MSLTRGGVVPHIIIRSPHPRLGKFVFSDPKRVLQHNHPVSGPQTPKPSARSRVTTQEKAREAFGGASFTTCAWVPKRRIVPMQNWPPHTVSESSWIFRNAKARSPILGGAPYDGRLGLLQPTLRRAWQFGRLDVTVRRSEGP